MQKIYFVTSNQNKLREVRRMLEGFDIDHIALEIDEIQSMDAEKIAVDKAKKAYEQAKKPVLVEDTGVYIRALGNFPGTMIRHVMDSIGVDGVCKLMKGVGDRSVHTETWFCLYDGKNVHTFLGELDGSISESPRGERFDWDRIFIPTGYGKTFAEMEEEEKHTMSARSKALAKLKAYLETT